MTLQHWKSFVPIVCLNLRVKEVNQEPSNKSLYTMYWNNRIGKIFVVNLYGYTCAPHLLDNWNTDDVPKSIFALWTAAG